MYAIYLPYILDIILVFKQKHEPNVYERWTYLFLFLLEHLGVFSFTWCIIPSRHPKSPAFYKVGPYDRYK